MASNSILSILQQLNGLIEEQSLSDYWQKALQLLSSEFSAQAVSLYLFEPGPEIGRKVVRVGELSTATSNHLEQWEDKLLGTPIALPSPDDNGVEIVDIKSDNVQLWHVQIVIEQILRGAMTFVFQADLAPSVSEHALLYGIVQMFTGNALRAQYLRVTRDQLERVNLLYQISQSITSSLELKTVFSQTTELAAYVLNAEAATLFSLDEDRQELVFLVAKGAAAHGLEEQRMPLSHGVAGWVATHGKSLIVNDTAKATYSIQPSTLRPVIQRKISSVCPCAFTIAPLACWN